MDNTIQYNTHKTYDFINKLYDNLNFYDLYGTSLLIFFVITFIVFIIASYTYIIQYKQDIVSDWSNKRCKPYVIPFAGLINKPKDKTSSEFTKENFQYCITDVLLKIMKIVLSPLILLTNIVKNTFSLISQSIDKIRMILTNIRTNIKEITQDITSNIFNVIIPIQQIIIAIKDTFYKLQGILVSSLYTVLGSYYALKSLLGAILELIIKVLIILAAIIVSLWVVPFSWPAAASMTAIFLSISIPLAIILVFMTQILNIQTSGIPKLRCFDKNTKMKMKNGEFKPIYLIHAGDILDNDIIVTSTIKVLQEGLRMFNLYDIIVSESHIVFYNNTWIPVYKHPHAKQIDKHTYNEPYLYCLNTNQKIIEIFSPASYSKNSQKIIFTDWDEIYDNTLQKILKYLYPNTFINLQQSQHLVQQIDTLLFEGFPNNTLVKTRKGFIPIQHIELGTEALDINNNTHGIIYGKVELVHPNYTNNTNNTNNTFHHLLVSGKQFTIHPNNQQTKNDYNQRIDNILHI